MPTCENCPAGQTVGYDHCKSSGPGDTVKPDVKALADAARRLSAAGKIDDVQHLRRARIFTYCGTKDCGSAEGAKGPGRGERSR